MNFTKLIVFGGAILIAYKIGRMDNHCITLSEKLDEIAGSINDCIEFMHERKDSKKKKASKGD